MGSSNEQVCNTCNVSKPLSHFYFQASRQIYHKRCKVCSRNKKNKANQDRKTKPKEVKKYADWVLSQLGGRDY